MVRAMGNERFQWGTAYFLTDVKESVFVDEPAVYVGKKDSDMKHPTICAVCGEPLGAKGYATFCFKGPERCIDMMIGNGCIKERIKEEMIEICETSPYKTIKRIAEDFPQTGRWYGTFLHHHIAKPYVRNKDVSEKWNDSIVNLPGVRYIMDIIDELRNDGWNLDAEMRLDCGNIDLLATYPERGTIVFDWKSDLCYDNHQEYIEQIERYMSELSEAGWNNISGYILWIREKKKEYVKFTGNQRTDKSNAVHLNHSSYRCKLAIQMNNGEEIRNKTSESHHRIYGDEVSFHIPPCEPSRNGYEFCCFEASPYREGEHEQLFNMEDAMKGFWINFICSKKRHSFNLTATWKKIRPYPCRIEIIKMVNNRTTHVGFIDVMSKIDENDKDYVDLKISRIYNLLDGLTLEKMALIDETTNENKMEWESEELHEGMRIRIPDIDGKNHFTISVATKSKPKVKDKDSIESRKSTEYSALCQLPVENHKEQQHNELNTLPAFIHSDHDVAKIYFTPGYAYQSGSKLFKIIERIASDKPNTYGQIYVIETDSKGTKLCNPDWRYIYHTSNGKEFFYGISNHKWMVYTSGAIPDLKKNDQISGVEENGSVESFLSNMLSLL